MPLIFQIVTGLIWCIYTLGAYTCLRIARHALELLSVVLDSPIVRLVTGEASPSPYLYQFLPSSDPLTSPLSSRPSLPSIRSASLHPSQDSEGIYEDSFSPLGDEDISFAEDVHICTKFFPTSIQFHPSLHPPEPLSTHLDQIHWAVRWEVWRLYQADKWPAADAAEWLVRQQGKSCTQAMTDLHATFPDAPNLSKLELKHREVWSELDDEDAVRQGSGNQLKSDVGAQCPPQKLFGGVYFSVKLEKVRGKPQLSLNPPEFGLSYRFSRVMGSCSLIRVNVDQNHRNMTSAETKNFFVDSTFDILGKRFQAMTTKGTTVILVEVGEKASLYDILHWHNPLDLNQQQLATVWASQFHLGLSTTEPLLHIPSSNVHYIDDFDGKSRPNCLVKIPENHNMIDGCGVANSVVFAMAQRHFGLAVFPTALQIQFGGAKGMLLLHPSGRYSNAQEPEIWLRPSQIMIEYGGQGTPAQRLLEVITASYVTTPGGISPETILNLHFNGVPMQAFIDLNGEAMQKYYDDFTRWEGTYSMQQLYKKIFEDGGVLQKRREREINQPRVRGLKTDVNDETPASDSMAQSMAWFPDPFSECPSTIAETILELLQHGFTPQTCPVLAEKLKSLLTVRTRPYASKINIKVPMSARVHCATVPDEFRHLLKENEIHFRSSKEELLRPDGSYSKSLGSRVSAILVRNPCKLPSDSQKVVIVEHPELAEYADIILIPMETRGSFCSSLSNGDYDRDTILVIWDPKITDAYTHKVSSVEADHFSSNIFQEDFESTGRTVHRIIEQVSSSPLRDLCHDEKGRVSAALQEVNFDGLTLPNLVSEYTTMHNKSIERHGYNGVGTLRLGVIAKITLDHRKSGVRVLDSTLAKDRQYWQSIPLPIWMSKGENPTAPPSVIKDIQNAAKLLQDKLLRRYSEIPIEPSGKDSDLTGPWERELARIEAMYKSQPETSRLFRADLESIERHVQHCHARTKTTGREFTKKHIQERQDILRAESRAFMEGPHFDGVPMYTMESLALLKASYAYIYNSQRSGSSQWPWNVAYGELCRIKERSAGGKERAESMRNNLKMSNLNCLPD